MPTKTPRLLSPEQRDQFSRIAADLPEREIARHYTFSAADLALIRQRRRAANRLGFAVQLAVLRYPGRSLADLPEIPLPGAGLHRRAGGRPYGRLRGLRRAAEHDL